MSTGSVPKPERKHLAVQLATGFAELSYAIYEPPRAARTVLCIPDFLGNSADFSRLAATLALHGFRVICPDLPGRGASAYLDVADYNPHTYMLSLLAVAQTLGNPRLTVIGKGWGGLLALGLAQLPEVTVSKLVLADLGFPWRLAIDDTVAKAAEGPGFPSLTEARRLLADSAEFAGMTPQRALPLIDGRLRQTDAGYGLDFDPALLRPEATARFTRVRITPLFEGLRAQLLYLTAGSLTQRDRTRLRAVISAGPNRSHAENLSRAARLHFTTSHELLLTLGFLVSRSLPSH
jgi:pimeloyl-ACP methyl ester carboxylesterase